MRLSAFWTFVVSSLWLLVVIRTQVPLTDVLRSFDLTSVRMNTHLMIFCGEACREDLPSIYARVFDRIQSFTWVNSKKIMEFWSNAEFTAPSPYQQLLTQRYRTSIFVQTETPEEFFSLVNLLPPKTLQRLRRTTIYVIWPHRTDFETNCESYFIETLKSETNSTKLNIPLDMNLYFIFFSPNALTTRQNEVVEGQRQPPFKVYELFSIRTDDYFQRVCFSTELIDLEFLANKLPRRGQFNKVEIPAVAQDDVNLDQEVRWRRNSWGFALEEFIDGSAVSMYRDFRDMLNFTERALVGSNVGVTKDEQVVGVSFELIESEQAVISISQITIGQIRARFFHFLQPTSYGNNVQAFFVQPPLSTIRNVFFAPFAKDVWFTVVGTWLLIIVLMMIASGVKCRNGTRVQISDDGVNPDFTFFNDAYIWAIGALCQKGWPRQPTSESMRIVFLCGCVTGLLVYVAYSASIVSVLSVKLVPVKEFSDLVGYNFLYYVHEKSSTLQAFLNESVIRTYKLNQDILKVNTEREVSILLQSKNALLSFADVFYSATRTLNYTERFVCETLSYVPASRENSKSAMFIKNGSPFKETFNHRIIMLKERGFNTRYKNKYTSATEITCASNVVNTITLTISDLYIAFLIVFAGFTISLLVLLTEKLFCIGTVKTSRFYLTYIISSSRGN